MTLNELFSGFPKIFSIFKSKDNHNRLLEWKYIFYVFLVFLFFSTFLLISHIIDQKNKEEKQNLNSLIGSKEFLTLNNYLISKINNPYKEVKYLIQNNDSIERILNKLKIKTRKRRRRRIKIKNLKKK